MREYPQAIETEKALLSALMLDGGAIIPAVAELISAEDFYRPEHRLIYQAILAAYDKGAPVDVLLVEEELQRAGNLVKVRHQYLLSLIDYEFTTARATYYAQSIKEKAQLRRLIDTSRELLDRAYKDMESPVELAAEMADRLLETGTTSGFETLCEVVLEAYKRADAISKNQGLTGVTTGLIDLNRVTNGLQKSELILLAARPSMGKTALAMNIGWRAAYAGKVVAVYSLEMSKVQLGQRLMSTASGVNSQKINKGNFGDDEMNKLIRAVEDLNKLKMYIDDTAGLGILEMRSKARRLKHEVGLDLIIIDYLQLMSGSGQTENRQQEISEISRNLKAMARELEVPILALSQLSRSVEMRAEKKPQLSDLRESGSLEQDADVVMFLYRDEYYNRDDSQNQNLAELIIAKNRNGPTTTVRLRFDKEVMKFDDLTTVEKI